MKKILFALLLTLLFSVNALGYNYYILTNLSSTQTIAVAPPYMLQPSSTTNIGATDYNALLTQITHYVNSGKMLVTGPYSTSGTEPILYATHSGLVDAEDLGTIAWYDSPLDIAYGGTGATDASTARVNLGIGSSTLPSIVQGDMIYASAVDTWAVLSKSATATRYLSNTGTNNNPAWGQVNLANGVTGTLPIANGGTGATTDSGARTALGLGSISTQASNSVSITGGSISGITDVAVADGGTGASDAVNARSNLGLGTIATQASNNVSITGGSVTGITDLAQADGGTGSSNGSITITTPATLNAVGWKMAFTAASTMAFGDVCYLTEAGKMDFVDADAVATCIPIAMCADASITAEASGNFLLWGVATLSTWTWTASGKLLYPTVTATTGNTLSETAPSATDDVIAPCAISLSATSVLFRGQLITVEHN